jgi:hypothetical protein
MPTTNVLYRRRFLNRPRHHLGAHVIVDVDVERPAKGSPWVDATLHLSDCSRHVTLDFSAETRAEAANALRKLAVLRGVLDDLAVALESATADAGLARASDAREAPPGVRRS